MSIFPKNHKARGPAKQKTLRIRSSDLEMLAFAGAAKVVDLPVATWARGVLRREAVAILVEGGEKPKI